MFFEDRSRSEFFERRHRPDCLFAAVLLLKALDETLNVSQIARVGQNAVDKQFRGDFVIPFASFVPCDLEKACHAAYRESPQNPSCAWIEPDELSAVRAGGIAWRTGRLDSHRLAADWAAVRFALRCTGRWFHDLVWPRASAATPAFTKNFRYSTSGPECEPAGGGQGD